MQTLEQLQSGQLKGTIRLKLSCELTEFPEAIFELAETLEILDLSGNRFSELPDSFSQLKNLRILFLSDNKFTVLPEVLSQCTRLDIIGFKANQISYIGENSLPASIRWLILTNNQLEYLPKSIGKCNALQKVMLAGNRLKELPEEMAECKKIELLRISANQLQLLPAWLFTLPRLAWLAFSGNRFNPLRQFNNDLPEIPWGELNIRETLGEGASGVIVKAMWRNKISSQEIAVKVFKGEVTSDGLPADEMNACIAAGQHFNLTKVLGKVSDHPERKSGLIFDLIPSSYRNLGGPPSFQTCTRDTFPDQTIFSVQHIICIALGIADVTVQLHAQGITHGDLYAHNILVNENAHPLLSDFGAASFYNIESEIASSIQRLEVRAFGCLLDDLLSHRDPNEQHDLLNALNGLLSECMNEDILLRPDFSTIYNRLKKCQQELVNDPAIA
ncbi:MAG TPA: leucine-rich repeat-containing protein kinase family protein [Cyclobacteriaceae bacterium]